MAESTERFVVYQLNNITLDLIKSQLSNDFNTVIKYTEDSNYATEYYKNMWLDIKGEQNFEIKNITLKENDNTLKYIYANGLFESGVGKDKAIINDELLPKNARIFNHNVDVCFFEKDSNIYSIIKINSSLEGRMRNVLFKFLDCDGKRMKRPKYNNVLNYTIATDFYYWIFYKSITTDTNNDITFFNISSLSQKDKVKAYNANSVGNDILNYTNVLSGLGEQQEISDVEIGLNYKGSQIVMQIQKDCRITVSIDSKKIKVNYSEIDFIQTSIFIYLDLLPELFKLYNREKDLGLWNEEVSSTSIKEWALLAITNLCLVNDIEISEIESKIEEIEAD
ncbi:hypothetical protein E4T72_09810 [Staphylococcus xylosus]|uniref:hypothetical protein n=1 Tax=Staphylococcus xylosus TaxID=1288 RepID=UPI001071ABD1|nr:hypothetical protein [Staphylococcus xylosus]MBF0811365.1 hypothetical protein [Staphylococcus xylosus]TFV20489.1 hypothetical protein E4T72_09810 [Staphylococcus xylosus]